MNEEMKSQKEEFLMEVQKQLLHKGLKSEMQEDGRLHVKWNDQPLCEVDEYGRAWCRPVSVTCPEMKKASVQCRKLLRRYGNTCRSLHAHLP